MTRKQFYNLRQGDCIKSPKTGRLRVVQRVSGRIRNGVFCTQFIELRKIRQGGTKKNYTIYTANEHDFFERVYTRKRGGDGV